MSRAGRAYRRPGEGTDPLGDLLRGAAESSYTGRGDGSDPVTGWRAWLAASLRLAVIMAIGFLLTIAYRQMVTAAPETGRARSQLTTDVRQRQRDVDELQRRVDSLRDEVTRLDDAVIEGSPDAAMARTRAAAGLARISGNGAVVRLVDAPAKVDPVTGEQSEDNPGAVLDRDLQDIANALWQQGADGIAVNGHRLTATTTIRAAGGAILVDFRPIASPYEVAAIGRDDLAERFERSATARRFRRYTEAYRMQFQVKARSGLKLPAGSQPRLRYATPAGSATATTTPAGSATATTTPAGSATATASRGGGPSSPSTPTAGRSGSPSPGASPARSVRSGTGGSS